MCLGKPKVVTPPPPQPAPTRDDAATAGAAERRRVRDQQGVYGNIFTSVLGDSNYNRNVRANSTVASIGA